jgi:DHA1 family bicyclomycin/chloramphenicol resistance-like MFS transporter
MLPPTEPDNLPKDPVIPVPLPAPHKITMLSAGGLATLLAALSMLGPFSIDAYLPAFPQHPGEPARQRRSRCSRR